MNLFFLIRDRFCNRNVTCMTFEYNMNRIILHAEKYYYKSNVWKQFTWEL